MKKVIALVLALVMAFSLATTAFAAETKIPSIGELLDMKNIVNVLLQNTVSVLKAKGAITKDQAAELEAMRKAIFVDGKDPKEVLQAGVKDTVAATITGGVKEMITNACDNVTKASNNNVVVKIVMGTIKTIGVNLVTAIDPGKQIVNRIEDYFKPASPTDVASPSNFIPAFN